MCGNMRFLRVCLLVVGVASAGAPQEACAASSTPCRGEQDGGADTLLLQTKVRLQDLDAQGAMERMASSVARRVPSPFHVVVVTDALNSRVQVCPVTGGDCATITGAEDNLSGPRSLRLDGHGNFVIADFGLNSVQVCPPDGEACVTVAPDLNEPSDAYVDEGEAYFIADTMNHQVLGCLDGGCITVAGEYQNSGSSGTQLNAPRAVVPDKPDDGQVIISSSVSYLLVADSYNHRIQRCVKTGGSPCTTVAGTGSPGTGATELNEPWQLVVDLEGNYIIADSKNHRIQKCPAGPPAQACTTVAGSAGVSGSSLELLNFPAGVIIDPTAADAYIVADTENHRVLRCAGPPSAACALIAGTGHAGSGAGELGFPRGLLYVTYAPVEAHKGWISVPVLSLLAVFLALLIAGTVR